MKNWQKINKHRLMYFSDALIAIIMTILVLDLKVPVAGYSGDAALWPQVAKQLPHFFGFAFSFAFICALWVSHHNLLEAIPQPNMTLAVLNFFFIGSVAVIPFSTALAAEYTQSPLAAAMLAGNLFLMNGFLISLHIYAGTAKLRDNSYYPARFLKIKKILGLSGSVLFLFAIFISFYSPTTSHYAIAIVPILHLIPIKGN
jgi:uncharacterized membrane protein